MRNWMLHFSTCRRPIDTKLGKLQTYSEMLPPLKLQDPLITWSQDPLITWSAWGQVTIWAKSISRDLWLLNLARCLVKIRYETRKHLSRSRLLVYNDQPKNTNSTVIYKHKAFTIVYQRYYRSIQYISEKKTKETNKKPWKLYQKKKKLKQKTKNRKYIYML